MTGALHVLQMKGEDVLNCPVTETHLPGTNLDFQMEQSICKMKSGGICTINLKRTWDMLLFTAQDILAGENPADVNLSLISSGNTGQLALLKFAVAAGTTLIAGGFTLGTCINQIRADFRESQLLVVTDPKADHMPATEASYANLPTIAVCNRSSFVLCGCCHSMQPQRGSLSGSQVVVDAGL